MTRSRTLKFFEKKKNPENTRMQKNIFVCLSLDEVHVFGLVKESKEQQKSL